VKGVVHGRLCSSASARDLTGVTPPFTPRS
jgi:hypothetical protein